MAEETKKKKNLLTRKLVRYLITIIVTLALMVVVLYYMQTKGQAEYQKNMSLVPLLDEVTEDLDSHTKSVEALTKRFHSANQISVRLVGLFLESGAFKELQQATDAASGSAALKALSSKTGMYSMMIIDTLGNLLLTDDADFYKRVGTNQNINIVRAKNNAAGIFTVVQFDGITKAIEGWEGTYRLLADGTPEIKPIQVFINAEDGTTNDGYYYSTPIKDENGNYSGYFLVAMADAAQMEADISGLTNMADVLESVGVGNGFVFSLDPKTGDFTFFRNEEGLDLTGENYKKTGLTDEILVDGYSGLQEICGTEYYCVTKIYSSSVFGKRVVIAATLPETELYGSRVFNIFWGVLAMFVVGNLILTYATIIQIDQLKKGTIEEARRVIFTTRKGKKYYYNRALGLKIFPLMVIGLLVVFGISIYTQTLSQLSSAVRVSESRINSIGTGVSKNIKRADTVAAFYNKQNLNKTFLLADIIARAPKAVFDYDLTDTVHFEYAKNDDNSVVTDSYGNPVLTARYHPNLEALCKAYDFESMYVFNDRGRVIATSAQWWNFVISDDPTSQSYPFRDVLVNTDYYVQDYQKNDVGESNQYIGCALFYYTYNDHGTTRFASEYEYKYGVQDENGRIIVPSSAISRHRGLLQTSVATHSIEDYLSMTTVEYTITGMNMFYDGYFLSFSADESHKLLYSPFGEKVVINTRDAMFSGDFNGFITINGQRYFSSIRKSGGIFIGTLIPTSALFMLRNNISSATVIIALISFLNLLGFMLYSTSDEDEVLKERVAEYLKEKEEEDEEPVEGSANFDVTMPDGKKKRVKSAQSRWSTSFTEWQKKSVEQKFSSVVKVCSFMIFAFVLISVLFAKYVFPADSIMHYIINGNLERSPNLFGASRSVMYLIVVLFGAKIAKRIINVLSSNLGARAETIGHLLESVIQYGGVLGVLFYSLYLMGLNTASLLTSAGILSIVVGLGAQSLISDILAGIFIVFEGEFRVGDIVTVGDFRGTVIEIGIRTTKIEDILGNIKIFNNSSISGVLNMTKEYSTVPIELGIEYGESLERVEAVLKEEFPAIKKKIKSIINGPFYKGVSSLGDNSVNILILAQCMEGDRIQLVRDMYRELYLIFNKHGINIPFPQVTVSYLKDEEAKKISAKEKREVEAFVKEQKKVSAGVDAGE